MIKAIHLRSKDIHPTILGSTAMVRVGRKMRDYRFDGGLMALLGMYDLEEGTSIAGTLTFTSDEEAAQAALSCETCEHNAGGGKCHAKACDRMA